MTQKPNGGPAYPVSTIDGHTEYGMSLRDAAILAALPAVIVTCANDTRETGESMPEMFARKAVDVADAMIAARGAG